MAKQFGGDFVDKKTEAKQAKAYYGNKICPVPLCNNAGVAKNNITGEGQWYCSHHVLDVNTQSARIDPAPDWREAAIATEREAHPERERQAGESMEAFAKRSIQFMRSRVGMIGK